MRSPITWPTASVPVEPDLDIDGHIAAQRRVITAIESALWNGGLNEGQLAAYQAAFRELERLIARKGDDRRHTFVIVIPVADRPRHLQDCLDSLLELCQAFGYGGQRDGRYQKLRVVIADDSADPANIAANRALAEHYGQAGIAVDHFGPNEQAALLTELTEAQRAELATVLGPTATDADGKIAYRSHKGQGAMRNLAYLAMTGMRAVAAGEKPLYYSIDSDQEFRVKVSTPAGDRAACAVNFFHDLDQIFSQSNALVLTGKVVGDPPVSPAVMTGNFLADVIAFLEQMAASAPGDDCRHHDAEAHREGEAAYHDMANLFGFLPASTAYRYRCPLTGLHSDADCFEHFSQRLNSFFYGEHPTRVSYYLHDDLRRTVQPARTVYAGNYVFRSEGLKYFIPFAALRLRMSGPTLGRIIKAELGERFVSANLPMLHKRTVETTGRSEFRPGIRADASQTIEMCGEFERQFFGDVMLFAIERLSADQFPIRQASEQRALATLEAVRADLLVQYNAKRAAIIDKLEHLQQLLEAPDRWWNQDSRHRSAVHHFNAFAANVAHNFGEHSPCREHINSSENWHTWRANLLRAILRYPRDVLAWQEVLARRAHKR
jgi:hypothetical protein